MKRGKLTPEEKARRAEQRAAKKAENPPKIHQITDNYRIVGRRDEFTPEERKVNKVTGEERWDPLGHHTKLGSAIDSISTHVTRDNLDDLLYVASQLDRIEEVANEINNKLK